MLWRATVQREDSARPSGFSPQQQQAQAGDAVFWYNEDEHTTHQPVSDSGTWKIPPVPPDTSSTQLSLANAGTFPYHCAIHPDETASILVANAVLIAAGANPLFGSIDITEGQSVSWGNADAQAHQPCPNSGDAWFTSPVGSGDLSAPVCFETSGAIAYHCALHPDDPAESGTINVAAS